MTEPDPRASAVGRLNVLLEGYRALRAEVNQRIGANATLVGFVTAGAAFVVSSSDGRAAWIAAAVVGVIVAAVWASNLSMLSRLAKELTSLEQRINACAALAYGPGADQAGLLGWDTALASSGGWLRRLGVAVGVGRR